MVDPKNNVNLKKGPRSQDRRTFNKKDEIFTELTP